MQRLQAQGLLASKISSITAASTLVLSSGFSTRRTHEARLCTFNHKGLPSRPFNITGDCPPSLLTPQTRLRCPPQLEEGLLAPAEDQKLDCVLTRFFLAGGWGKESRYESCHANLAAAGPPIIPVSRPSFCRVPRVCALSIRTSATCAGGTRQNGYSHAAARIAWLDVRFWNQPRAAPRHRCCANLASGWAVHLMFFCSFCPESDPPRSHSEVRYGFYTSPISAPLSPALNVVDIDLSWARVSSAPRSAHPRVLSPFFL